MRGINKEMNAVHKNLWSTFPIQVDMFLLLYFSHSKVEAANLNDVKLVDIEFKNNDPQKYHRKSPCQIQYENICA
jgi:hypothetical protein